MVPLFEQPNPALFAIRFRCDNEPSARPGTEEFKAEEPGGTAGPLVERASNLFRRNKNKSPLCDFAILDIQTQLDV
jgi:hypothetical protein